MLKSAEKNKNANAENNVTTSNTNQNSSTYGLSNLQNTPNSSSKSNLYQPKSNKSEEGYKKVYQENGRPMYIKKSEYNQQSSLHHADSRH